MKMRRHCNQGFPNRQEVLGMDGICRFYIQAYSWGSAFGIMFSTDFSLCYKCYSRYRNCLDETMSSAACREQAAGLKVHRIPSAEVK